VLLLGDGLWAASALRHLAAQGRVAAVVERLRPTSRELGDAARALGLDCRRFVEIHAPEALAWIRALAPDLLLSVSYDQIFGPALLDGGFPPILNVHAGHPARQRGRAVLCWQLLEGARAVELCALRVGRGIDNGPLLALSRVALAPEDDYGAALERVAAAVPALLDEALAALARNEALPAPGAARPVYYPRRLPGDEWIDWSRPSAAILRQVRALAPPNPLARTRCGERELRVGQASPCADFPAGAAGAPGAVIGRERGRGLLVKTGDGALWISALADAEGSAVPWRELHLSDRLGAGPAELELLRRRVSQLEERLARLEAQA
jgi:methionyl-tRNA formyltransferase